ncbi:MAG TPA: choice-of-anchor tandem repeat GloVer-containing protein [Bacteroidia bacterium]
MKRLLLTLMTIAFCLNTRAQYTKLLDFNNTNGGYPYGSLMQASDGMLYGMTYFGGISTTCTGGCGVLFQYNPATTTYAKKIDFDTTNGGDPYGSLMQASNGMLYGMTYQGGVNNYGVLFQYNPTTSTYTKKLDFVGTTNGSYPYGSLMQASDGMLYGMTGNGGANTYGVLFQYNPATSIYTKKLDFAGTTNGRYPNGTLMQASDGMLYGMTSQGGASDSGVIFQYNPTTNTYINKFDFAGTTNGQYPTGSLIQASDGMLYGMTYKGGASNFGVLFQYNPTTNTYTKKLDFAGISNGSYPNGSLMQASDGMLYGLTYQGGANSKGALFQYNTATNTYIDKFDFNTTSGFAPAGSLMQASNGMLYGMTVGGGANGAGALFKYGGAAGIEKFNINNEISIYPNPTKDVLNVECLMLNGTNQITISDILGNAIYHSTLNTQHSTISVSDLAEGIYNISISSNEGVVNKRVVIVR